MANELNYTGQNKGCREKPTSRVVSDDYRKGWDAIFAKKKEEKNSPCPPNK